MPATEKTWRDTKQLHLIFGISSIVMFLATIWLLAADHYREWKDYQRKFQEIENWTLVSRDNEQATQAYAETERQLTAAVNRAAVQAPDKRLVEDFAERAQSFEPAKASESQIADFNEAYQALIAAIEENAKSPEDDEQLAAAAAAARPVREQLIARMNAIIADVKFLEDGKAGDRKFRLADFDANKSQYDLGVRDGVDATTLQAIRGKLDEIEADVNQLSREYAAANEQRLGLEAIVKELTAAEDLAQKQLDDHGAARKQLQDTLSERTAFGRGLLEMPIIDAFGRPLKIDQIWLPDLTLNNNFREVARFDRCTTCHQGIDKTAPGSAVLPGFPPQERPQVVHLAVPSDPPPASEGETGDEDGRTTQALYGFQLAEHGLINRSDVVVAFVWPRSAAAEAGLQRGDMITHIQVGDRNEALVGRSDAQRYLLAQAPWGQTLALTIRRGFPNPFSSHPRLDLFVGSLSPHKKQDVGCTICHEGQGSATEFKFVSHTPNSPQQAEQWQRDHNWFDNHHWIFPMKPNRFVESNCLKCHHEVTELEPSERFPEPPAPKLVHGYRLVQRYGCYGCHEINGYDGPLRRIGPDLRNEPQYYAAAQQLDYQLSRRTDADAAGGENAANPAIESMRALAEFVSYHPDDDQKRHQLLHTLQTDAARGGALKKLMADPGLQGEGRELLTEIEQDPSDRDSRQQLRDWINEDQRSTAPQLKPASHDLSLMISEPPVLPSETHRLVDLLKDVEVPGSMRKTGPSLRYVASKLGTATMAAWIERPQNIRPSSKMPAFYGLHDHFRDSDATVADTKRREETEILSMAHYLHRRSQPFAYAPKDPRVTEPADYERGKTQFEIRGCLACHAYDSVPHASADHGPNLSNLGIKIRTEKGQEWLRSWLLQPDRYHRRTKMPNTYLEPQLLLGDDGKPQPVEGGDAPAAEGADTPADTAVAYRMSDPAADIAAYLLGEKWKAIADDEDMTPALTSEQSETLTQLALEFLKTAFSEKRAKEYLETGIPERLRAGLKGAEVELVGGADQDALLTYVGRRTMSRAGCAGCHDIPGFEGAKPIGTTMADWGRKETSKLAFEHITHYVAKRYSDHDEASHANAADDEGGHDAAGHESHGDPATEDGAHDEHHALDPSTLDPDDGYFVASLLHHQREGFLRQKLLEPRSYDYKKVENKKYHDRLRMPQFPWAAAETDPEQREKKKHEEIGAVMTFVLGLVAEPPNEKYVYKPDARREAIIQGEKVVQKFNCAGCHMFELGRWDISYRPGDFEGNPPPALYPFLKPEFSTEEIYGSKHIDWRGMLHGTLRGVERVDRDGNREVMAYDPEEEDYLPLEEYLDAYESDPPADAIGYSVELWEPTYLDGQPFLVKDPLRTIPSTMVTRGFPPKGGDFARLMLPIAVDLVRKTEPTADGIAAMAWVPPPLVGQGRKTHADWLTEFLIEPYPIRPGVLLRMPKFNMSRADAGRLAQYFAARDHADYPAQYNGERNQANLAEAELRYQQRLHEAGISSSTRLDDALKIVINKAGCISCHSVYDQAPEGGARGNGPNLGDVYRRLQPSYMKRWIALPSFTLPYTKMQALIPYKPDSPPTYGGFELPKLDADGEPVVGPDGKPQFIELYHGTSIEQLEAVVDLLANFGLYMESQTSIRQRAKEVAEELESMNAPAASQPETPAADAAVPTP